jgi:Uncharacterized protein conserved in bacteria C-term(DUF2220)
MMPLVKVAREAAAVPVYHWGDIDAGGIRIAAHLEDAFGVRIELHEIELAVKLGTPLQPAKVMIVLQGASGNRRAGVLAFEG